MRIILTEVYDNYSAATVLFLFSEMISEVLAHICE